MHRFSDRHPGVQGTRGKAARDGAEQARDLQIARLGRLRERDWGYRDPQDPEGTNLLAWTGSTFRSPIARHARVQTRFAIDQPRRVTGTPTLSTAP